MDASLHESFLVAYDTYADAIFRHCYFRLGDRERGKELMQETFMKAWEFVSKQVTINHMRAFLYRIANNLIIDEVRKKHPVSLDEMMEETGFEPEADDEHILEKIDAHAAMHLLEKMESGERQLITMRYIDDLSPHEISDIIEESANVVSVRLNRAVKKLRTLYNPNV